MQCLPPVAEAGGFMNPPYKSGQPMHSVVPVFCRGDSRIPFVSPGMASQEYFGANLVLLDAVIDAEIRGGVD